MSKKYVYLFSEGNATMRELLGGKGANLAEMTNIGLPVPQGFTITTEACTQYYEDGRKINDEIMAEIMEYVAKMEEMNGKKFGDLKNPLLVSVRSGARASMPGMMDTILNLGLNDDVVAAMIAGNPDPNFERFVYDSYRRFIQMFSDADRRGLPLRPQDPAVRSHPRRVPLLGQPARERLSPRQRHPLFLGHCRQRHADGLRQPERQLRYRRRLHP